MSHTPGPWQTTDIVSDGTLVYRRIEAAKRHIGCVYLKDNAEADARLIAAAPALLKALTWCEKFITDNYTIHDMPELVGIRAALAKVHTVIA